MNNFEKWPPELHHDPAQIKRRLNSEKIKPEAVTVDAENLTAVIVGSDPEPYLVTLEECTCYDFCARGLPCKHIYRLADELGILEPWPKIDRKGQRALLAAAPAEVDRWRNEFLAGRISATKFIKISEALMGK